MRVNPPPPSPLVFGKTPSNGYVNDLQQQIDQYGDEVYYDSPTIHHAYLNDFNPHELTYLDNLRNIFHDHQSDIKSYFYAHGKQQDYEKYFGDGASNIFKCIDAVYTPTRDLEHVDDVDMGVNNIVNILRE